MASMDIHWANLIEKRDVIRTVRDRWNNQYRGYQDDYMLGYKSDKKSVGDIRRGLEALDLETCTEKDINNVIGPNTNWASIDCDGCGKNVDLAVRLGQEPDYEARWQDICPDCLSSALKFLKKAQKNR